MEEVWSAGYDAYINGQQLEDNPYIGDDEAEELWRDGWCAASEEYPND